MTVFDVLSMIGGLCLFLFGMNIMGDGLERRAGSSLKTLLGKLTDSKIKGFLTGLGVTAVILPEFDRMMELGQQFLDLQPDHPQLFYIWGHSYEFDIHNDWKRFEEFLEMISGKEDIFYCTNKDCLL